MNFISRPIHRLFIIAAITAAMCRVDDGQIQPPPTTQSSPATDAFTADTPLPQDPADVRGEFPNGLHYLIRKNANPPGKVYLDLAVRTGSLNENDNQNGLAHFLEHMAFKGSAHYAPTKLIPMLTHLGMRFGADTNAHTNSYETVFKLVMPDTKPETLDVALTIFSDYANGLSLFPIQIESERRVILEEMRSRMSAGRREQKEEYARLFPGSQMAVHDTIGDTEIIRNAPPALFEEYWNTWYRPEEITLVVVGDVDPQTIITRAKPWLGTFTARAPLQPDKAAGLRLFDNDKAVIISDAEQVTADVQLLNLRPARPIMTTFAQYRQRVIENTAQTIVNRRMSGVINSGRAPFQSARISSNDLLHGGWLVAAHAQGEPEDWKKSLGLLVYEIKHAIDDGFTQREWENARDSMLASAEEAIKTESTRDSSELVASFATSVDIDIPLLSSQQQLDLLKQAVASVTIADLQNAFSADFNGAKYAYVLKLPAPTQGRALPTEAQLLSAARESWDVTTHAERTTTRPTTTAPLLAVEPTPGRIASRNFDADLELTTVVFENGVVMHHRFSDYKKDQVGAQINLPGGVLEETPRNRGISAVASLLLDRPATSNLTSSQIRTILANKNVSVRGAIGTDSMSISVNGSPADFSLGFQLINAVLADGRLEMPAVDRWKKLMLQSLRGKPLLAEPQLADALSDTVMGGDIRFGPITPDMIQSLQRAPAEAWFKRIADHAPIEVSIVGDIPADDAVEMVGKYLGSLPKRTGNSADLESVRHITRDPGPFIKTVHYTSAEPKAMVMVGFITCDEHDPDRRPLALAALILIDRMVQRIRFDQQLVYSISCSSLPGRVVPGTGMITARTPTDPRNADRLAENILGIMKDFADNGPSEDELNTAKKQMANELNTQLKDPRYWLAQFSELEYHHKSLAELKQLPGIYNTFSTAQVREVFQKYAKPDRLIRIEVLPDQPTTAPTTAPAPSHPAADGQ